MGTDTFLGQGSSLRKPVKEKDWVNIYEHETSVKRGQIETRGEDINRGGKGGGEIGEKKDKRWSRIILRRRKVDKMYKRKD